jgi:hypothetical protein
VTDRKIEITVETYEVLFVKQRVALSRSWCASCSKQVAVIGLNDACAAGLSASAISSHEEDRRIHLIEIPGEQPLICLNSLIKT